MVFESRGFEMLFSLLFGDAVPELELEEPDGGSRRRSRSRVDRVHGLKLDVLT